MTSMFRFFSALAIGSLAIGSPSLASTVDPDSTIGGAEHRGIPMGVSLVTDLGVGSDRGPTSRWASRFSLAPSAPVHGEVLLRALRPFDASPLTHVRADARLVLGPATRGMWLGVGQEPESSDPDNAEGTVLGLGGWTVHDRLTISASVEQAHRVSTTWAYQSLPGDSGQAPTTTLGSSTSSAPATAAQLSLRWTAARLTVETAGGFTASMHSSPYRWGQAVVSVPMTRQFALFATAGSRAPRWFALDPGGGQHAALGLRFTEVVGPVLGAIDRPAAAPKIRWHLEKNREGWRTLVVVARRASMVEVMGDMTTWSPIALSSLGGDRWMVELPVEAGVHEIELRIDGGVWVPPPGAPTRRDGFNGEVGLIVIE